LHSYFDTLLYEYEAQNEQLHAADLNQQLVLSARWTNCKNAGSVSWNKNYSQTVSYELFSTTFQSVYLTRFISLILLHIFSSPMPGAFLNAFGAIVLGAPVGIK